MSTATITYLGSLIAHQTYIIIEGSLLSTAVLTDWTCSTSQVVILLFMCFSCSISFRISKYKKIKGVPGITNRGRSHHGFNVLVAVHIDLELLMTQSLYHSNNNMVLIYSMHAQAFH